jgi:hypothetical protein
MGEVVDRRRSDGSRGERSMAGRKESDRNVGREAEGMIKRIARKV